MTTTNRDVLNLIRRAKSRISDHHRWTREAEARDSNGQEIDADSKSAARWCALGSLDRESTGDDVTFKTAVRTCDKEAENVCGHRDLTIVNDEHGRKAVIKLFNKVIYKLSSELS